MRMSRKQSVVTGASRDYINTQSLRLRMEFDSLWSGLIGGFWNRSSFHSDGKSVFHHNRLMEQDSA